MSTDDEASTGSVAHWWADNPMTYGSDVHGSLVIHGKRLEFGTKDYYEELDKEFYRWNKHLHGDRPFSRIFPYEEYRGKRVLEVGCGQGTMASNWAREGADVTAVDLNPQAVEQTKHRFELLGLDGNIQTADGRVLPFDDGSFDYVYSWGVLHHSPDLEQSLSELIRVLKGGGGFGVMLYNRRSLMQWWVIEYVEGFLHYEKRFLTPLQLTSRYTDGAEREGNPHTWPVTKQEMRDFFASHGIDVQLDILGDHLSIRYYLPPVLRDLLPAPLARPWTRRFGWSLWSHGKKPAG